MKKIGLALGAGGARGLAHICFLEVFEELGIKPAIIGGSSIGAVIGAVYAAGLSASEIRQGVDDVIFAKPKKFWELHKRSEFLNMMSFIDPQIKNGGIIKGEKFINFLGEKIGVKNFEDLKLPLKIIATDLINNQPVIFDKGELLPAIRASYSIPGLFSPIKFKGKTLVDAGLSNPLPYDVIASECDYVVAIDVSANKTKYVNFEPSALEVIFAGFTMMQRSIIREKMNYLKPDIYIDTDIKDVRVHEFRKAHYIYEQVKPLKNKLKKEIEQILN